MIRFCERGFWSKDAEDVSYAASNKKPNVFAGVIHVELCGQTQCQLLVITVLILTHVLEGSGQQLMAKVTYNVKHQATKEKEQFVVQPPQFITSERIQNSINTKYINSIYHMKLITLSLLTSSSLLMSSSRGLQPGG